MSILGNILGKIFRRKPEVVTPTSAPAPGQPAPGTAAPAAAPVDVAAVLDAMNEGKGLNWRTSIVDLMKLTGMDSSLAERKELAGELGYTGDTSDSAAMNIWLHKQVMQKIRDNGGRIPDLTD
ncbi:DUF3597 domain-containing protein [Brevundimonas sp. LjRoot202]|uniref:DUF3597 domain-containing protein n=1 Tax=Brevundimonas sp. LjRoot202 TaxID=3342281 RepID=UPI003ECFCC18